MGADDRHGLRCRDPVLGNEQYAERSDRLLGRWMRMVTIPNQSSVRKAYEKFDEDSRMKPPPLYDRIVVVKEQLVKLTLMLRGSTDATARGEGRLLRILAAIERTRLLITDDWGPEPLPAEQRRDLLEIVDDRYDRGLLLITSQVPFAAGTRSSAT